MHYDGKPWTNWMSFSLFEIMFLVQGGSHCVSFPNKKEVDNDKFRLQYIMLSL